MNGPHSPLLAWLLGLLCVLGAPAAEIRVLTTLPAIQSWAANVAGDAATVEGLLPANVGPHDFQFRPSDLRKLAAADVVLMNGLGVDTWLTRAVAQGASKPSRRVVTVTDGLQKHLIHHRTPLAIDPTTTGSKKPPRTTATITTMTTITAMTMPIPTSGSIRSSPNTVSPISSWLSVRPIRLTPKGTPAVVRPISEN